jgi:protein-tyrosine phosphatase/membrane-associated phospholipid phosphatase
MGHVHGIAGPARAGLMFRAARTSVLLSLLFLVVYGSTNWFTAQRPDVHVGTWLLACELTAIPFVPLFIVPYMSLDLLFFLAPFLCRDDRELRVFAQRVGFSILVAAAFFLVLPLKLAWPERPHIDGWFGGFLEQSCTAPFLMEYPHNLFPALHITLSIILADIYARHLRGIVKVLLSIWFTLIALSTVLTWQHHLIDIAGGAMLGGFAIYLFRESGPSLPVTRNLRIGSYYLAGAATTLPLVVALLPWGVFLLWPAAALAVTAAGYFGIGPHIYRKADGRLPISARFVLAPVLIGQYLSLVYYRRRCPAWDCVAPGVVIGRRLTCVESAMAVRQGVTAVLDLTAEFAEAAPFRALSYRNLPILDLTAPTQSQLGEAAAFIAQEAVNGTVYVHCKIGYSRSAAAVGAYLLTSQEAASAAEAVARLRRARPSIVVRQEAIDALHDFAERVVT